MNDCFYFIQMELFKPCSLITKALTSISLMIIAVSMIVCCYQISNTKINSGLMFHINGSVCKGDVCEYNLKGTISLLDDNDGITVNILR